MDKPLYQHYIITRFNLKQYGWTKDKNNNSISFDNDDWLKERFELFETYCFPSVISQTDKNFKWLVYFDIDTPENYKSKIKSYQKAFTNFSPRFIPGMDYLLASVKKDIIDDLNDIVITTRLDNDDSLHESFVEKIQSVISNNHIVNGVVDIPNGYCLQISPIPILSTTIQYSNAFITYIEPLISIDRLITVMDRPHGKWLYSNKTFFIKKAGLWMQIIHEKNVVNTTQGIILNDEKVLKKFHIYKEIKFSKIALQQVIFNDYVKFPVYYLKKQLKRIFLMSRKFLIKHM